MCGALHCKSSSSFWFPFLVASGLTIPATSKTDVEAHPGIDKKPESEHRKHREHSEHREHREHREHSEHSEHREHREYRKQSVSE